MNPIEKATLQKDHEKEVKEAYERGVWDKNSKEFWEKARAEMKEEILGMIRGMEKDDPFENTATISIYGSYNQALVDLETKIKEL